MHNSTWMFPMRLYPLGTVNTSAMNQTGIQQNIGPRVVRAPTPKGVIIFAFSFFSRSLLLCCKILTLNLWKKKNKVRMYHGDIGNTNSDSLASQSPALCGEPFAYNPHSGMYIKFGKTYITHVSVSFLLRNGPIYT